MPTFANLDNYAAEVTTYLNGLDADLSGKWDVPTPGAAIADATENLADVTAKFNTLLARLVALGLLEADAP